MGVDAGGAAEVAAEVGGGGEIELVSRFLDGLFGVRIHEQFGLRHDVLLDPFEGCDTAAQFTEPKN